MAYFRSDGWVKSVLGQAIAGAQIYVCTQPADVSYVPPIPQAVIYSDSAGLLPITQPLSTDGFGHYDFYVAYGTYTVVVVTGGNIQQVYQDQTIGFPTSASGVSSVFGRTGDVVAQTGDYSVAQITGAAPLVSPVFTGIPTAPTASLGTNTNQVATCAFVLANSGGGGGSVTSVFGRTGAVTAQTGDYSVAQITGAAPIASPSFTGTVQTVNAYITGTLKDSSGSVGTSGQVLSSTVTGTAWTSSGSGSTSTSLFTKMVYTASQRAIGSVYQNLTGQPIIVAGFLNMGSSTATSVCDSSPSPTTVVNEQLTSNGLNVDFLFVVPNNDYYEVSGSGVSFGSWTEWTINSGSVTFSGELSGSRSLSSVYRNTSGKALLVCVDLSGVGSGTTVSGISDSSASPSAVVWQSQGQVTGNQTMWMVVPNNDYYEVTCSGAAVAHWNEYTMPFGATKSPDYAASPAQRVPAYSSNLDNRSNNTQPMWATPTDKWLSYSDGNSGGAATIIGCAFASSDPTLAQGVQCVCNNTVGNKLAAVIMLMQSGEFYQIGRDGSGVLAHWWEYILG